MTLNHRLAILTMLIATTGCESPDQRLVDFAEKSNEQQARQSELVAQQSDQVARQGRELASVAQELVEQDAAARRELIQAHERAQAQLRDQQSTLDQQRQQLHSERSDAAQAMLREPVIAQAVIVFGMILAALLPLIVTAYALRRLPVTGPAEELLTDALLDDLSALSETSSPSAQPESRLPASSPPALPPGRSD